MVASLTMLFIEKKPNLKTFLAIGLTEKGLFSIFFFQGVLISFSGIIIGLMLGYSILAIQYFGKVLILPNSGGDAFPVVMYLSDLWMIVLITTAVGLVSSWLPVRYLVKKFVRDSNY
jgi:lipoprotein-releasing system permease protein